MWFLSFLSFRNVWILWNHLADIKQGHRCGGRGRELGLHEAFRFKQKLRQGNHARSHQVANTHIWHMSGFLKQRNGAPATGMYTPVSAAISKMRARGLNLHKEIQGTQSRIDRHNPLYKARRSVASLLQERCCRRTDRKCFESQFALMVQESLGKSLH